MSEETTRMFEERWNRIQTAVRLEAADRVPFVPKMGTFVASGYGLNLYDHMKDARNLEPCVKQFLADYTPDMMWPVVTYPIDPCQYLDAQFVRFPGPGSNRPLTASFQILDDTYMEEDEFDEFLLDPTHFLLTKVIPRKYKKLGALSKLYCREIYELSVLGEMAGFADDELQAALRAVMQAGELCKRRNEESRYIFELVESLGFPHRGGTILAPFDSYADSLRGFVTAAMDVLEYPDETLACLDRIEKMNTKRAIAAAKRRGDKFVYIPLHAGGDEFMSPKNYETFYWPGLKRTIEGLVAEGLTPYVFCEGKYNTRLETLKDVPKGKVVYLFEQVDIREAKRVLGDTACICGNLSSTLLAHGTPQQVADETKRLLDICAPGGGFIMDCSIVLDSATHENLTAWRDTTFTYGTY